MDPLPHAWLQGALIDTSHDHLATAREVPRVRYHHVHGQQVLWLWRVKKMMQNIIKTVNINLQGQAELKGSDSDNQLYIATWGD